MNKNAANPSCVSMDLIQEEQDTLELCSPMLRKQTLKFNKRLGKTEEKLSDKLDTFRARLSNDNFFSYFSPQVKTHSLHPENPYNIDLNKPIMAAQSSYPNSIFRDYSFTQDSFEERCSSSCYEDITSQLEPVPLVMDTCYSGSSLFELDSSNSIVGSAPQDSADPIWRLSSPPADDYLLSSEFAYTSKEKDNGLFDDQHLDAQFHHPAVSCLLSSNCNE